MKSIRTWKTSGIVAMGVSAGGFASTQPSAGASTATRASSPIGAPPFPGATHYDPTSTKALPGGGTLYTYEIQGQTVQYPVPPKGFDPLKATNAQLTEYGFPPRPSNPSDLASWTATWSSYRTTPTPDVWTVPPGDGIGSSPPQNAVTSILDNLIAAPSNSMNWAGYVATPPTNKQFNAISAQLVEPTGNPQRCVNYGDQQTTVQWVGLGGYNAGTPLIQAGTAMNALNLPGPGVLARPRLTAHQQIPMGPYYSAWWEVLLPSGKYLDGRPSSMEGLANVTIRPGDRVIVDVRYAKTSKTSYFDVTDMHNGSTQLVDLPRSGEYYSGTTGEVIDERPLNNTTQAFLPLMDFGTATWSNARLFYKTTTQQYHGENLGQYKNHDIVMTRNGSPVSATNPALAYPGPLVNGTGFNNYWHNCQ